MVPRNALYPSEQIMLPHSPFCGRPVPDALSWAWRLLPARTAWGCSGSGWRTGYNPGKWNGSGFRGAGRSWRYCTSFLPSALTAFSSRPPRTSGRRSAHRRCQCPCKSCARPRPRPEPAPWRSCAHRWYTAHWWYASGAHPRPFQ